MRKSLAFTCSVLLACSGSQDANNDGIVDGVRTPDNVSQVAPSSPVGTISGQVLKTDFMPLDTVHVQVTVGGTERPDGAAYSADTDSGGNFAIKNVPAGGEALVTVSKALYATARFKVSVPAYAGNFPLNNGNADVGAVLLTKIEDSFKLQLVTADGRPAYGAKAFVEVTPAAVRYQDFSQGYGQPVGIVVGDVVTADPAGMVEFKNLPNLDEEARLNGTYSVTVAGLELGGQRFLGIRQDLSARSLYFDSAPRVLTLPFARPAGPVRIVATNVESLMAPGAPVDPFRNMVKPGDKLYFVFDQAVVEASLSIKVTDELGTINQGLTKMLIGTNVLEVTLASPVESGREYNVALRVSSAENGSTFSGTGFFFGGDPASPKPIAIEKMYYEVAPANATLPAALRNGEKVTIIFNQPVKLISGQAVEVLIDYELDGVTGRTALGEKSLAGTANPNTNGFPTAPNEPIFERGATFANAPSGYTTRHEFIYMGVNGVPVQVPFTVFFSELASTLGGYHTLWGLPVENDLTSLLSMP
jgi:hypothetical protein